MHVKTMARLLAVVLVAGAVTGCKTPFGPEYEYEEQLYLTVKGSATVIVDSSLAALVALRGVSIDRSSGAQFDRDEVRRLFEAAGCRQVRVGQPWVRYGRRFVQIRMETEDVRTLSSCGLLSWSAYTFTQDEAGIHFEQRVGAASGKDPGAVNWKGDELIAFKLHLPSRILYHNVRRLSDGAPGERARGNILTWEQRLTDRRAGQPVHLDVRIETQPILYRTLLLFGGSFVAAMCAIALAVFLVMRLGRRAAPGVRS